MSEFDKGPPVAIARILERVPDPPVTEDFWFDWGPVFYRGRLTDRRASCASRPTPGRPSGSRAAASSATPASACRGSSPSWG